MNRDALQYIDRQSGKTLTDPIYARGFLHWSYNTRIGWWITDYFFSHRTISRIYGWYCKRGWSKRRIRSFVECLDVDLSTCTQPIDSYRSLNDFVTRPIDLAQRPIAADEGLCLSPADARVWVQPKVSAANTIAIKRAEFNLGSFLADSVLAAEYDAGTMLVFRLYLADYHHFHFPDSGVPAVARPIRGKYFAVTPYSHRWFVPYFRENCRQITRFESDHFGPLLMVEVGAFTIGSIQQRFEPGTHVARCAHKGFFELGGSIVVLLFQPNRIEVDADLVANSEKELETYVRLGEAVGRAIAPAAGRV